MSENEARPARLLVTGAAGFVGAAVCRRARVSGWEVVRLVRRPEEQDLDGQTVVADLEVDDISALLAQIRVDAIVHAAGPASVPDSLAKPASNFRHALLGWLNVLEAIRQLDQPITAIYVSSAAVYGQPDRLPVPEVAPCSPVSPYGYHKWMCETLGDEYAQCYGIPVISTRIFSLFGPAQRRLLTWELASQILGPGSEVRVRGTGRETRDFLHVDDAADALLGLVHVESRAPGLRRVNLASGREVSVSEMTHTLAVLANSSKKTHFEGLGSNGDPERWSADVQLLRSLLPAWQPKALEQALGECLEEWRTQWQGRDNARLDVESLSSIPTR